MASPAKTKEKPQSGSAGKQENGYVAWAGTVKAIGLKSLEKGQFVTFGLIIVAGIIAHKMESSDVVEIFKIISASSTFAVVGWFLFVLSAFGLTYLLQIQRQLYIKEIERITTERNDWQQKCVKNAQSSGYKAGE